MMEHVFTDRDGIDWSVTWKARMVHAQRIGGEPEYLPAGLEFRCAALVFRVSVSYRVHPRAIPRNRLQAMVDGVLEI